MKRSVDGIACLGLLLIGLAGGVAACSSSDDSSSTPDASSGVGLDGSTPKDATAPESGAGDAARPDSSVADSSAPDATPDATAVDGSTGDATTADSSAGDGAAGDGSAADGSAADAGVADATAADGATGDAAAEDAATTAAPGLVNARTVPVTAATPLAVASGATLPTSGATGVPVDTLLRIGFDAAPVLGAAGTISIHQVSDGSIVDTIDLADPYAVYDGTPGRLTMNQASSKVNVIGGLHSGIDQVRVVNYAPIAISGNTATIFPHNNKLAYGAGYYVTIDAGVLTGTIAAAPFAGITSATAWTFTTKAAAPTTLDVAADDSADFATVQGAIDALPAGSSAAATIHIAPGVYQELLFVRNKKNITFEGSNSGLGTVIQYENFDGFNPGVGGGQAIATPGAGGTIPGYGAAAANLVGGGRPVMLLVGATGIVLDSVTVMNLHPQGSRVLPTLPASTTIATGATSSATFVNYSSPVTPAETLYFNTSFTATTAPGTLVARHSNFVSYQDTLQLKGFAWFYDSFVTGDTDFIWGNANAALFENCEIKSRNNPNGSSVVQSRAYLGFGDAGAPGDFDTSYPGFVFLNSALTKEDGTFTAYLARSPGAATVSGTAAPFFYLQYDIVSYVGCTMDSHIAPVGWNVSGSNPPGANVRPNPVAGWREYKSLAPDGGALDVSQRLVDPSPAGTTANPGGSLQLSDSNAATFFPDRAAILHGATDGTFTTTGLPTFAPAP
jgi:pectin methylesterase-like acyl-CoA thioesterase